MLSQGQHLADNLFLVRRGDLQHHVPGLVPPRGGANDLLRVERLFDGIQGQAAVTVARARADRWTKEFRERARAETFPVQLLGLAASPRLYRLDKYLDVLTEGIKDRRKYVLGLERDRVELWLNLEQPAESVGDLPLGKKQ